MLFHARYTATEDRETQAKRLCDLYDFCVEAFGVSPSHEHVVGDGKAVSGVQRPAQARGEHDLVDRLVGKPVQTAFEESRSQAATCDGSVEIETYACRSSSTVGFGTFSMSKTQI